MSPAAPSRPQEDPSDARPAGAQGWAPPAASAPDAIRRMLPNAITVSRLLIAAAFFALLAVTMRRPHDVDRTFWGNLAVAMFIVAAVTDLLDGWLARRWQVVSVFGRIMDPFCDKVLVLGAFIFLAGSGFTVYVRDEDWIGPATTTTTGITAWMVVVILARELLVTTLRGVLESMGRDFSADRWGKWKMALQSVCVPVALFVAVNPWALDDSRIRIARDTLVFVTVAVTALSALPYLLRAATMLGSPGSRSR